MAKKPEERKPLTQLLLEETLQKGEDIEITSLGVVIPGYKPKESYQIENVYLN